jgi:predicted RecA/RadA family phage recombinase
MLPCTPAVARHAAVSVHSVVGKRRGVQLHTGAAPAAALLQQIPAGVMLLPTKAMMAVHHGAVVYHQQGTAASASASAGSSSA